MTNKYNMFTIVYLFLHESWDKCSETSVKVCYTALFIFVAVYMALGLGALISASRMYTALFIMIWSIMTIFIIFMVFQLTVSSLISSSSSQLIQ
jgi:hypothetical protein